MRLSVTETMLLTLRDPASVLELDPTTWSDLMPRLRRCGLLGSLAVSTRELRLPEEPRDQLMAALAVVERQQRLIDNEVTVLGELLAGQISRPVLLKGAAYQALGLPNASGRFTSDVDVMVPKRDVDRAEQLLLDHGWQHVNRSEYDHRYYRDWMHELPPMRHAQRGTFIDLHHAITPPISRISIDSEKLFVSATPIAGTPFHALAPSDMVLHSICHVLSDGEFGHAIRDFLDIHMLIGHFSLDDSEFWEELVDRAAEHGVERMLFYAVSLLKRLLQTSIPDHTDTAINRSAPMWPIGEVLLPIMRRAVLPERAPDGKLNDSMANLALVARSHYLRMPLRLLIPHLARKGWLQLSANPGH